jgi:hypothetical protein
VFSRDQLKRAASLTEGDFAQLGSIKPATVMIQVSGYGPTDTYYVNQEDESEPGAMISGGASSHHRWTPLRLCQPSEPDERNEPLGF